MSDEHFPALSVRQPWAELIISGRKQLEIRSWETNYRGRIWVHAGLHVDKVLDTRCGLQDLFRGGFTGSVELTSIEPVDARRWEAWRERHLNPGPYQPGLFAWVLLSPKRFHSPVRAVGRPGLYQLEPELLSELSEAASLMKPVSRSRDSVR